MFTNEQVIAALPAFTVASAGTPEAIAPLALLAAQQCFPLLATLAEQFGHTPLQPVGVDTFAHTDNAKAAAARLKTLFDHYGSDKASHHDYHHLYGAILEHPDRATALLEVGLGTNNEDVVSNMGAGGRPGSSLRAFRDYLPNASIFGADVDKRILFNEERIRTFYVDQTDVRTFDALAAQLPAQFDLIIDDGLHSPNANLATAVFALPKLKPGGVFVIEDIHPAHLPVWQTFFALMQRERYSCFLIAALGGCMVAIQRKG